MRVSRALAALCAGVSWLGCGADEAAAPADAGAQAAAGEPSGAANQPPVIHEVKLTPLKPRPGESVSVKVNAQDPEGEPLSYEYRWRVGGAAVDHKSSSYHVESVGRDSSIEVTVIAHDPQGGASEPMAACRSRRMSSPYVLAQVRMVPRVPVARSLARSKPPTTEKQGRSGRFETAAADGVAPQMYRSGTVITSPGRTTVSGSASMAQPPRSIVASDCLAR